MIRPIPDAHGVGFMSQERLPQYAETYREHQVGRFWNYHVTTKAWQWPEPVTIEKEYVIDAFAPNLNKQLHVGHLRQLAIAASLSKILRETKFVALLGADGILKSATDALEQWFKFVGYNPTLYYDALMPKDADIVVRRREMMPIPSSPIELDFNGNPFPPTMAPCDVWDGPKGPVIVVRGDGRPTYAFHDLAFAKIVGPTHYITGSEQNERFKELGLGDKHLSMGLVLGMDGKKIKSRTGDALTAQEALEITMQTLTENQKNVEKSKGLEPEELKKLAWNVLSWNFLHCARSTNVKFDVQKWTDPNVGGLYITYTYARFVSALRKAGNNGQTHLWIPPRQRYLSEKNLAAWTYDGKETVLPPNEHYDLTEEDAQLLGYASYYKFYLEQAKEKMDPAPLANFALDLARRIGAAYHKEQIVDGRYGFCYAIYAATQTLRCVIKNCGMFDLDQV